MELEFNPDLKSDRELALVAIADSVRTGVEGFAGWKGFKLVKRGSTLTAAFPSNVTTLPDGLVNRISLSLKEHGWKIQSSLDNETSYHIQGVKTRLLLETKPEQSVAFALRFI